MKNTEIAYRFRDELHNRFVCFKTRKQAETWQTLWLDTNPNVVYIDVHTIEVTTMNSKAKLRAIIGMALVLVSLSSCTSVTFETDYQSMNTVNHPGQKCWYVAVNGNFIDTTASFDSLEVLRDYAIIKTTLK